MPKMSNHQAKKRLQEALAKVTAVYISQAHKSGNGYAVASQDMIAFEKLFLKCMNRL